MPILCALALHLGNQGLIPIKKQDIIVSSNESITNYKIPQTINNK